MKRLAGVMVALAVAIAGCTASGVPKPGASTPARTGSASQPALETGGPTASALAGGHWSTLPAAPIRARQDAALVWTGRRLLEFGGTANDVPLASGAAYDPSRRQWRRMASPPASVGTADEARVWTGGQLFVFGGRTPPYHVLSAPPCCVGGLYDPGTNRWGVTSRSPLPALTEPTAVWTGTSVVVVGLSSGREPRLRAAGYDPSADSWQALEPPRISGHNPVAFEVVGTSNRVILWSMWDRGRPTNRGSSIGHWGVDVFALTGARWSTVTGHWPQGHTVDHPIYTGAEILFGPGQIWCGVCPHPPPIGEHGYRADPTTLAVTAIAAGPFDDIGPWIVWAGRAEISLNASGEMTGRHVHVRPGAVAFWNPKSGSWTRGPRAPTSLDSVTPPVWAGTRLYALASDGRVLSFAAR